MTHPDTLAALGLARAFAGVRALDGVDLTVVRGEVVGLIGPNGAGKSTLVNLMTGFDRPDAGSVSLDGADITTLDAPARARRGLARTFQHGHLFGGLSVRENAEVAALGVGASRKVAARRAAEALELVGLGGHAGRPAAALTHGEARLLGVARALATEPRYVLLDEPAAGLNEVEADELVALVRMLADERGDGVLLIDHNVAVVLAAADRVQVLDQGTTLAAGSPAEIRSHPAVVSAYLGAA